MKCKFCQEELEEGVTLCPACGKENADDVQTPAEAEAACCQCEDAGCCCDETLREETAEQEPPARKLSAGKLAAVYAVVLVLVAALAVVVLTGMDREKAGLLLPDTTYSAEYTIPADRNPDDVTCKGTYTVSDAKARWNRGKVVAKGDGAKLTNKQLQIYYWMQVYNYIQNYDAAYSGLDTSIPLDRQDCVVSGKSRWTWQQFFLDNALCDWHMFYAFSKAAEEEGFVSDRDMDAYVESVRTSLEESAVQSGYKNADEMIKYDMGAAADFESYLDFIAFTEPGYDYYDHIAETMIPTAAELDAFYAENEDLFIQQGIDKENSQFLVNVRHVLIRPEGAELDSYNRVTATDEQWEACRAQGQALIDAWVAEGATEEGFAELAKTHSLDGNAATGGIYENVQQGQMVQSFNDWCFDESRQYGDYGLVKTEYGYHLMFFIKGQQTWEAAAYDGARSKLLNEYINSLMEKYPVEFRYEKVVLAYVGD